MSKIKAVIFDLGGVLINVNKDVMAKGLAKHSSLSAEEISQHFSDTIISEHEIGFCRGLISQHDFLGQLSKVLKLKQIGIEEFDKFYSGRLSSKEDTLEILRRLAKNYSIGIISNTNILNYARCAELLNAELGLFKAISLSYEVHSLKPAPAIYVEALRQLNLSAPECVYIDDVSEYAESAGRLGMNHIQFVSAVKLESDLKKLGVSF